MTHADSSAAVSTAVLGGAVRLVLLLLGVSAVGSFGCSPDPENNDGEGSGVGGTNSGGGGANYVGGAEPGSGGASPGVGGVVSGSGGSVSGSGGVGEGAGGTVEGTGGTNGTKVCAAADENGSALLTCPSGQVVESAAFASYGSPTGTCGNFVLGDCHASNSESLVEDLCVGRASCSVPATNGYFGDPCSGVTKNLLVEAVCVPGTEQAGDEPYKGVANSPCEWRQELGVSWYYNWMDHEDESCNDGSGGEFVPMIWDDWDGERTTSDIEGSVASFVSSGYRHVLAFNEPNKDDQASMDVTEALALWPAFDNPNIAVGSPATSGDGQAWFEGFMSQVDTTQVDFVAIHWYGWNAGSCDPSAVALERYIEWAEGLAAGLPIWITEWGCLDASAADEQTVIDFYNGAVAMFARHPRVVRYAWYPWATHCHLHDDDGELTALGEAYAAAPAYR